jgi:hypothetical protein
MISVAFSRRERLTLMRLLLELDQPSKGNEIDRHGTNPRARQSRGRSHVFRKCRSCEAEAIEIHGFAASVIRSIKSECWHARIEGSSICRIAGPHFLSF